MGNRAGRAVVLGAGAAAILPALLVLHLAFRGATGPAAPPVPADPRSSSTVPAERVSSSAPTTPPRDPTPPPREPGPGSHLVLDLSTKYAGDPAYAEKVARLREFLPSAVRFVRDRLGIAGLRPEPHLLIELKDLGGDLAAPYMRTMTALEFRGALRPMVVVRTEDLVAGAYDVEKALRHEIVHAWQMEALGTGYRTLPEWAREGLAEWATGRGDDFLREACRTDSVWPEDDPVSLAGMRLAPGRHGFADYVRSYLAFAYVEERHGTAAVQGIARRLFAGTDVAGAVAEATGLALDRFEEKTRAAAAARIREAATGFAEYRACHLAFLQGRRAEAVDGQRAFLGRMPDSPFAPSARLDLVRALFELGRRDEAGGEIEALLSAPGDRGILEQAEYYAIRIAALEGRRDEVRDRGRRFLRDFVRARPALRAEVESALLAAGPR